jgi:hypothetical protein
LEKRKKKREPGRLSESTFSKSKTKTISNHLYLVAHIEKTAETAQQLLARKPAIGISVPQYQLAYFALGSVLTKFPK